MAGSGARMLTLALVTLAGWAAAVALVALAGLGGRYALHPVDASLGDPLPAATLARVESRIEPFEAYAEVTRRPLFNSDRRPLPIDAATDAAPEAEPAQPLDLTLTSVVLTRDVSIAIVSDNRTRQTQSVRMGASLEGDQAGWRLVKLEPRLAVFEGPTGRSEVELRVFDGSGAAAPTPLAATPGERQPQPEAADGEPQEEAEEPMSPESRAEMIRRRIEERRRQMREEAARAQREDG
ncbi:MAG TPA: hypothetical protein VFG21_07685 [Xanthomonadaceae bacterium]|nr:hypothetical protein [Xanthomonadaceae bacterium]